MYTDTLYNNNTRNKWVFLHTVINYFYYYYIDPEHKLVYFIQVLEPIIGCSTRFESNVLIYRIIGETHRNRSVVVVGTIPYNNILMPPPKLSINIYYDGRYYEKIKFP